MAKLAEVISHSFEKSCPVVTCYPHRPRIKLSLKLRQQTNLVNKLRRAKSTRLRVERTKLRKLEQEESRRRRQDFLRFLQKDPMNLYRTFSRAKSDQNTLSAVRRKDDTLTTNPEEKAQILAEYYNSVYKEKSHPTCD